MPSALLIATSNPGKLRELERALQGLPVELATLAGIGSPKPIEETGGTFAENAVLKAVHASTLTDSMTLADDSGLEVDALAGEPGVMSARYGGPGLTDEERNALVLERLEGVEAGRRTARFRCVLALAQSGALIATFEGSVEGVIACAPRGANGFGYDSIFFHPPSNRTFGELAPPEKDALSHRGQALAKLRDFLGR